MPEHSESGDIQEEPLDDYTLEGDSWDRLYLDPADDYKDDALTIVGRNYLFYGTVDL